MSKLSMAKIEQNPQVEKRLAEEVQKMRLEGLSENEIYEKLDLKSLPIVAELPKN